VGELGAPHTTGLDNASSDPCSDGNPSISPTLQARCIATGMTAGQVGVVQDITAGQINGFFGTDLNNLPNIETADTTTFGVVWTPDFGSFLKNPTLQVDYYKIHIDDYISQFGAQEILDQCYVSGLTASCAKVKRLNGDLVSDGSGIELYTTNLKYITAEGLEIGFSFGIDIGGAGSLIFAGNINHYLTQESQSSNESEVIDCLGFYGTQCGGPLPETSWNQTTTWQLGDFSASLLWRHIGSAKIETAQLDPDKDGVQDVYEPFQQIDAYDFLDLYGSWQMTDALTLRASVTNMFEKEPPVVGNEAADTRSNSGNTFPSRYDTLGRVYSVGINVKF
jgi:outer membrane receptor protein involved in Fe transport